MGVQNPNSTDYVHSDEPNLLNIHKAMQYRNDGTPELRVNSTFEGNIVISGNVNIPGEVTVSSTPENPVHVHLTELGTFGNLTTFVPIQGNVVVSGGNLTVQQGTTPWVTTGNANVTVIGNIAGIATLPAIRGNVSVSGNVSVDNFPSNVSITSMPSITGNVGVTGNVNIGTMPAITGNVTVTPPNGSYNEVHFWPSSTNNQLDTSGRLRVSTQGQNWWYVPAVDKDGDLRYHEKTSGTSAAVIWIQYLASIDLTAGTDSNGYAIRASRRRHKMRPGTAHQWYAVANWCGRQTNTAKRLGMFTVFNGIFYELLGDDLYAVIRRRLVDGTLVEKRIKRSAFNVDKLDGTGPTGYNFDTSKTIAITGWVSTTPVTAGLTTVYNVVLSTPGITLAEWPLGLRVNTEGLVPTTYNNAPMITAVNEAQGRVTLTYTNVPGVFSSVGVGARLYHDGFLNEYSWFFDFNGSRTNRVRFSIQGPNGPMLLHVEDFGGQLGSQYENAPALMERAEVYNTGSVNHLPALKVSGTAFNTEAEVELNPGFAVASNNNGVAFVKQQTQEFAILGVGLRAGEPYQRSDLQIQRVQITDLGNVNPQNSGLFYWRLLFNPTLGGDFTAPGTATQYLTGKSSRYWKFTQNTTFSGGIELFSGYAQATTTVEIQTALNFLNLGSNIDYTDADRVVLVVKQLVGGTDNGNIVAAINFIEAL